MADRKEELRKVAQDLLPDPIIVIGYLEHQLDLMAMLVKDLYTVVDETQLSDEAKERLAMLDQLLKFPSINFNDLDNPLEAYKIPKATELKGYTRKVQERYLKKQMQEGVFGE